MAFLLSDLNQNFRFNFPVNREHTLNHLSRQVAFPSPGQGVGQTFVVQEILPTAKGQLPNGTNHQALGRIDVAH
jgi:hypothetical protein